MHHFVKCLYFLLKIQYYATQRSNFATHDTKMEVNKDVERVVRDFVAGKKPIGFEA